METACAGLQYDFFSSSRGLTPPTSGMLADCSGLTVIDGRATVDIFKPLQPPASSQAACQSSQQRNEGAKIKTCKHALVIPTLNTIIPRC